MRTIPDHVPADLVHDFDHVLGPDFQADPFRAFARNRHARVFYAPSNGGYWVLTSAADIRETLQHPELFSSRQTGIPAHPDRDTMLVPLELDPPEHTSYRRVLAPLFSPKAVAAQGAVVEGTCRQLIDRIVPRGSCDFRADFAQPFPTTVFTLLLGLPLEEADRFVEWNETLLHNYDPEIRGRAGREITEYLRALVASRETERRDDLLSTLLDCEVDGRPMRVGEVYDFAFLLFIAGLDTVTAALSFAFRYLAEHPAHRAQLVADPSLAPAAVEELLRVHSFINMGRTVARDVEWCGVQMKAGDRVLAATALAGIDPEEFPEPFLVRFDRAANRHLAFGAGPHRCAGSHLARREMTEALVRWHAAIPDYEVVPDAEITVHAGGAMGLDRLPLTWEVR